LLMLLLLPTTCDCFLRDHPSQYQAVRPAGGTSLTGNRIRTAATKLGLPARSDCRRGDTGWDLAKVMAMPQRRASFLVQGMSCSTASSWRSALRYLKPKASRCVPAVRPLR
jgi:hypothetical protein